MMMLDQGGRLWRRGVVVLEEGLEIEGLRRSSSNFIRSFPQGQMVICPNRAQSVIGSLGGCAAEKGVLFAPQPGGDRLREMFFQE